MEELIYSIDWELLKHKFDVFMWGDPNIPVVKGWWVQAIMAAVQLTTAVVGARKAKKEAEKEQRRHYKLERQIKVVERGRADIPDPGKDIKSLASTIYNPAASLQVGTKAAEIQAEESDLALASSVDLLRATGASAGGATALAQAATRSKRDISGNIEKQEMEIARLRAQGESEVMKMRLSEEARVQAAQAHAEQWMFGQQEARDMQQLNRLAAMSQNAQQQAAVSSMASQQMLYTMIGQAAGTLGSIDSNNTSSNTGTS